MTFHEETDGKDLAKARHPLDREIRGRIFNEYVWHGWREGPRDEGSEVRDQG